MSDIELARRIVRYVHTMTHMHRALLGYVNGQIADGDDSDEAQTMRNMLEQAEIGDTHLHHLLTGGQP